MSNWSSAGYTVFTIDKGIVNDERFKLYWDREAVIEEATCHMTKLETADRYANEEHPDFDPKYLEDTKAEYARRREAVSNLQSVDLSPDIDLIIKEVLEEDDDDEEDWSYDDDDEEDDLQ